MQTWPLPEGAVTLREEKNTVRFRVDCASPCEPERLLRCYGEDPTLLLGVLEPRNGRLTLERRISREALRQAGITGRLPHTFYLSDNGPREAPVTDAPSPAEASAPAPEDAPAPQAAIEAASLPPPAAVPPQADTSPVEDAPPIQDASPVREPPRTGDPLLDAALSRGGLRWEPSPKGLRITCPLSPGEPFPLAFLAPLCRVEEGPTAVLDWTAPQGTP